MQVFRWLHQGVESFSEMTNLPRALRERLETECVLTVPRVERKQVSKLDGTINPSWASLSIFFTSPQVDREMWRIPIFIPSG